MPHSSAGTRDETCFEQDPDTLAQRYCDEIQSLLAELWTALPGYRKETGEKTYCLVRENLEVLTGCFYTNALSVQALGVLRDHLWMLLRLFSYRTAEAERQLQRDEHTQISLGKYL